jgi:hypothetical protein
MTDLAPPRRRSWLAVALQVAAAIGAVLCLTVIVATWFGRSLAVQGVDDVAGTVDTGIQRAITATETVGTRLDTASAEVAEVVSNANEVASNPITADPVVFTGLSDRVDQFAAGYQRLRVAYADIRENVASAMASLRQVARFVPGVDVPAAPGDRLANIDSNVRSLDDAVAAIRPAGLAATAPARSAAASAIATKATSIQGAIDRTAALVDGLSADLKGVQATASNAAGGVRNVLLMAALAISILFVWVLLLNLALWRLARTSPRV